MPAEASPIPIPPTAASALPVFDRARGTVCEERIFGERALRFFYSDAGRPLTDGLVSRRAFSHVYGWLQRRPSTRRRIARFVEELGIDASEAERPIDAYASLDDFFTRRLRPEARPIDPDPAALVSPADGRLIALPVVGQAGLAVKGARATVEELLGSEDDARPYRGGAALIVRLAPADYHRFHFADGGVATASRPVNGRLHSVHPIALEAAAPSLRNRRMVSFLDSSGFGRVAMVDVGALCVGTIVQTYQPGPVARGAEKGYFRFGGSTVILLFQPGAVTLDADLIAHSRAGLETLVQMGSRIGRRGPG